MGRGSTQSQPVLLCSGDREESSGKSRQPEFVGWSTGEEGATQKKEL